MPLGAGGQAKGQGGPASRKWQRLWLAEGDGRTSAEMELRFGTGCEVEETWNVVVRLVT